MSNFINNQWKFMAGNIFPANLTRGVIHLHRLIFLLCFLLFLTPATAAPPTSQETVPSQNTVIPGNAYIPKGTVLRAELITTIDSTTCKPGDKFSFKLLQHVIVANTLVIPRGTIGEGIVKSAKRAGAFGKGGSIELEAVSIPTLHGVNVPLSMHHRQAGGGHQADLDWYDDNMSSATPSLTIGVMTGLASGSNIQLSAGTKLSITIPQDIDLQATPADLPGKIAQAQASVKPPTPSTH